MTSSRLILIFLGIIFFIIILLSNNRLTLGLRESLSKILPGSKTVISLTPTPTQIPPSQETGQTMGTQDLQDSSKGGISVNGKPQQIANSSSASKIPSTGPEDMVWIIIVGGLTGGILLRKMSSSRV